jgi:hypothetical protein
LLVQETDILSKFVIVIYNYSFCVYKTPVVKMG